MVDTVPGLFAFTAARPCRGEAGQLLASALDQAEVDAREAHQPAAILQRSEADRLADQRLADEDLPAGPAEERQSGQGAGKGT